MEDIHTPTVGTYTWCSSEHRKLEVLLSKLSGITKVAVTNFPPGQMTGAQCIVSACKGTIPPLGT